MIYGRHRVLRLTPKTLPLYKMIAKEFYGKEE